MLTEKTRSTLSPTLKQPNAPKEFLPEPKPKPTPTRNLNYIKEIIISSADDSTTHGIDHYFKREHPFIRFVWATCFLVSAAVCFYMIAMSIVSYLNYETVTKAQQISELTVDFPAVSFCNLNPYLTNSSWDYVEKILVENGFISALAPKASFKNFFNDYLQVFRFLVGINSLKPNLTDEFRKTLGFDLNETLLSCTYNMAFCSADDFEWYYDLIYGNCYKFNTGKFRNGSKASVRKSSKAGSINGLTVELFLYKTNNPLSLSTESGAHVLVHNKSDKPAFFKGLGVGSGLKGSIEVERSFTYHLEKPYSDCTKEIDENYPSELVKTMLQNGYKYTQQNCFLACYQDFSFKTCGCYDMYSQVISGVPLINATGAVFCTNMSQIFCDVQEYALFSASDVQSICGDRCPLECESVDYNMYASYTDYPSEAYAESLMQNPKIQAKYASNPADLTYDSLKRNLVQVSVYYGDLGYILYEELENMSLEDLISNIGGTLGLFLGMSFLSFMEILDVILQIIFYKKPSDNNKVMP